MPTKPSNVEFAAFFDHPVGSRAYIASDGVITEGIPGGLGISKTAPNGEAYGRVADQSTQDGWWSAQNFGEYNYEISHQANVNAARYHTGEDWNINSGDDAGQPVYAAANGLVVRVGHAGVGEYGQAFGNYVVIKHWLPDGSIVYSLYAHLQSIDAYVDTTTTGDFNGVAVTVGRQIGLIGHTGAAGGHDHLHLEMYSGELTSTGTILDEHGYSSTARPNGWIDPTNFINAHRGPRDDYAANTNTNGTVSTDGGRVSGNIERSGDKDWYKIELVQGHAYTFHLEGGTPPQSMPFLADPSLSLYNSNGGLIKSDDNNGPGLGSEIEYTAEYTGVFFLEASSARAGGIGTYRIWDPPATETGSVSITNVNISEGNSGSKVATFTVTRAGGTAAFNVNYWTSDGGAKASDNDYVSKSGTLQFVAGDNSETISVVINGDNKSESDEAFFVNLTGATDGATIDDNLGIGTITDDDGTDTSAPIFVNDNPLTVTAGTTATITSNLLSVSDNVSGSAQLTFTVVTAPSHGSLLKNGSATSVFTQADIDNGNISFHQDGSSVTTDSFIFSVADAAGNRTANTPFQFQIVAPQNPILSLSPASVRHNEGSGGVTTDFTFLVTLSKPSSQQITAQWFTTWSSTFNLLDFTGGYNGDLTFAPGVTTQTITMHVVGDNTTELDESFVVHLINSSGAQINANANLATGTLLNDDAGDIAPPVLGNNVPLPVSFGGRATIASASLSVDDPNTPHSELTYTVTSSPAHGVLQKNGVNTSSFLQSDVDNNLITYQEDGSVATADSFTFYVSDPAGNRSASGLFQFELGGSTTLTVLGDEAMWDAGGFQLVNSFENGSGNPPPTFYYYSPVHAFGFTLTNLSRTDFAFTSWNANAASTFGYFYDGPHVLSVPIGSSVLPSTIQLQRDDQSLFDAKAIDLDTFSAFNGGSVTFSGVTFDDSIVTQTFSLNGTQGMQTFSFGTDFSNLKRLTFTPSANVLFDNFVVAEIANNAPVHNDIPVATVPDHTLSANEWAMVQGWIFYSDANGDAATQYQFWDGGTGANSGYFLTPDNAHNAAQTVITIGAADLGNTWVRGGLGGGSEAMYVRAFDGVDWSAWDEFALTTIPNTPPLATINDHSLGTNEWSHVASWISYSDAEGNPAIQYQFWDGGAGANSGYFLTPDNGHNPAQTVVTVTAADLGNTWVRGGQSGGSETMYVRAFDGIDWSTWDSFTFTTIPNTPPVATINDHTLGINEWARVTNWLSYSDAEGNPATQYQFWDGGAGTNSGYFLTPDNAHNPAQTVITVTAADLGNTWVRGGLASGSETLYVRAFDGTDWSTWDSFTLFTV